MKKTLKIISFALLTFLVLWKAYDILSWKDTQGGYISSTQQLYATEDNLIDVLFVGSSHTYASINPSLLWDEYGISAFDMSVSGQDKDSSYYGIKEVLKTQSPKVVFVDCYGLVFDEQGIIGNVYRNMLAMNFSENSNDLIRSYVDEEEQKDFLLRWPIIHTRYRELQKYDFEQYEFSTYGRGYLVNYQTGYYSYLENAALKCTDVTELNEKNKKWIDDLVALSEEENFKLVFYLTPYSITEKDKAILNGAEKYFKQQNITFLDLYDVSSKLNLQPETDFSDYNHLNSFGADKVTAYMGTYLEENFALEDHSGDEAYYLWNQCSEYVEHRYNAYNIDLQGDLSEYLRTINECPGLTVVISLDGKYDESTLDFKTPLELYMGISEEDYYAGGKWVFQNGRLVKHVSNEPGQEYLLDLNDTDTLKIEPIEPLFEADDEIFAQVKINNTVCGKCYNGITVTVYDNFLKKIVSSKGYF